METWLICGLLASLFWGSYAIVAKVVTSENYLGLSTSWASILMVVGITIVFLGYFISQRPLPLMPTNLKTISLGILVGCLWAGGMLFTFIALKSGANVSKLTPIYNTNTLVAVFLGILILHELPIGTAVFKVIIGAILIVLGAVLVGS